MSQVPVTAEWALWGKEPRDAEYRLLECSDGILGAGSFTEVVTRYLPGTLEHLPQVTIGWVKGRDYVALAIHHSRRDLHDASHRRIVFTSCFCLPYEDIAAGAVSYHAMHSGFAGYELRAGERSPIHIDLDHSAGIQGPGGPLAMRVAALLLTSRPVCIVGADDLGMEERLRFVDSVMALLPYGMRIELSASTWVSSTAEHRFRLFFADAPRSGRDLDDHVVTWGWPDQGPIGHRCADDYLTWLSGPNHESLAELAARTEPVRFDQTEIVKLLERMHVSAGTRAVSVEPDPARVPHQRARPWPWPRKASTWPAAPLANPASAQPSADGAAAESGQYVTIEDVLRSCAGRLTAGHPIYLEPDMNRLRSFLQRPIPPEDRPRYRQIITDACLLCAEMPVPEDLRSEFYRLLLALAFEPLSYQDLRALEDSAGRPLHRALLDVIEPGMLTDLPTLLLILEARGHHHLRQALRDIRPSADDLVSAAANRELADDHARALCEAVIGDLRDRAGSLDRAALRQALAGHGYLAARLSKLYPGRLEYQREQLGYLLRLAHGSLLDRRTAQNILESPERPPTSALFAATLSMIRTADAAAAERAFSRGLLGNPNFARSTREHMLGLLPEINAGASLAVHAQSAPVHAAPVHAAPAPADRGQPWFPGSRFPGISRVRRLPLVFWIVIIVAVLGVAVFALTQLLSGGPVANPVPATPASAAVAPASPSTARYVPAADPCELVSAAKLDIYLPGAGTGSPGPGNCSWTASDNTNLFVDYQVFASGAGTTDAQDAYRSDLRSDGRDLTLAGGYAQPIADVGTEATAIIETANSDSQRVVELLAWSGNAEIKARIMYQPRNAGLDASPPLARTAPLTAVTAIARDILAALPQK